MSDDTKLLPCPFCGGPAGFEECPQTMSCTWSIGCQNGDEDCIAYQMLAHFNRKSEAAEAWNKRPAADEIERLRDIVEKVAMGSFLNDTIYDAIRDAQKYISAMARAGVMP